MRVAWIARQHKNKTYRYPFVVSSYRNEEGKPRTKVQFNLTGMPEHVVEAIEKALREGKAPNEAPQKAVCFQRAIEIGASWATIKTMEKEGVLSEINKIEQPYQTAITSMIVDRVINDKPYSTRALHGQFKNSGLNQIQEQSKFGSLEQWYLSLEKIYANQSDIQKALFKHRKVKGKRIILYDISSSYFEGDKCPLAAFGYNRDGKKGKKQIVYGAITDDFGCPIGIKVFEGNTKDETTVLGQIDELRAEFEIEEVVFVGDRGMITASKVDAIKAPKYRSWLSYITAVKRSDMMDMADDPNHPIQIGLFDQSELAEVCHKGIRYVLCHNPLKKEEDAQTRKRLLEKTEEKLNSISNQVKKKRLKNKDKIAKRLYRWINRWKMERFFTVTYNEGVFEFSLDQDKVDHYSKLDGCYVVTTDMEASEMDKKEIVSRYKSLSKVEQLFRTMKTTEIMVRPIRRWNPERVKGHLFVCMLAYLIIWHFRQKFHSFLDREPTTKTCVGGSLREILDSLKQIQIATLKIGDSEVRQVGSLTEYHRQLFKALGVTMPSDSNGLSLRK